MMDTVRQRAANQLDAPFHQWSQLDDPAFPLLTGIPDVEGV